MGQWFNGPGEDLATLARETGYPVVEVDGWQWRGHGPLADHVGVVVCHHTASCEPHETSSNAPALDVVTHGRAGLEGPLSQYVLGYDGTIYVVAAGNAWHAGTGGWRGMSGNEVALGIEAEDAGDGDWTAAQLDAYPRLVARICQFLGINAAGVCGHKEWTSRKIDPAGIDMHDFRRQVADYLAHPHTIDRAQHGHARKPAPAPEPITEDIMPTQTLHTPRGKGTHYVIAAGKCGASSEIVEDLYYTLAVGYDTLSSVEVIFPMAGGGYGAPEAGSPMVVDHIPKDGSVYWKVPSGATHVSLRYTCDSDESRPVVFSEVTGK